MYIDVLIHMIVGITNFIHDMIIIYILIYTLIVITVRFSFSSKPQEECSHSVPLV